MTLPCSPDMPGGGLVPAYRLTRRRKAAIIVRLLLGDGIALPIDRLPPALQAALTDDIATMHHVDGATLREVVQEFLAELDQVGLTFPGGLDGAMDLIGKHLSPEAAARIDARRKTGAHPDPWSDLARAEAPELAGLLSGESPEIAAVALSRLPRERAAAVLGAMPARQARQIALAVSRTGNVAPAAVDRIGAALLARQAAAPLRAFDTPAETRMGSILDIAPASTRDSVLESLAETDAELARKVRRAVFTFSDIPMRLSPRDVAALIRSVDQDALVAAIAGAGETDAQTVEFILANMSQRLADQLRDAVCERVSSPPAEEVEAAQARITAALRQLEADGEITLIAPPTGDRARDPRL
ncbi:flagellar motor switch protein FliG [Rhodovulum bhavnagarense]|uniref:Flagellar motor switch protein FliG n=1 Tax=Rhodovulum bhavnagarense TaxID=992286 RepID=A0A4R2RRV3_9RHOB|nr:FliG C-terminal domain-containing protein [Rhodovulum bhavnagarense]TCP61895.1 flagellar motor switch protein FliG [Rhodovulum bhavnagarense]